jgi:hypothetical protein
LHLGVKLPVEDVDGGVHLGGNCFDAFQLRLGVGVGGGGQEDREVHRFGVGGGSAILSKDAGRERGGKHEDEERENCRESLGPHSLSSLGLG